MPSVSQDQQQAVGMALAVKRGKMDPSKLKGLAREMYDSMNEKQLKDFAETEHKGLPEKIQEMNMLLNISQKREVIIPKDISIVELPRVDTVNIFEAKYKFSKGQSIGYRNKDWKVKKTTSDWVEIIDNRGFSKLIDFKDIKSFKNGTLRVESYSKNIKNLNDRINLGESGAIPKITIGLKLLGGNNNIMLTIKTFILMRTVIVGTLKLKNKYFKKGHGGKIVIPLDCAMALEFSVDKKQNKVKIRVMIDEPIPRKRISIVNMGKTCTTIAKAFRDRYHGTPIDDTIKNPTFWSDVKKLKKYIDYEKPWEAKDMDGTNDK